MYHLLSEAQAAKQLVPKPNWKRGVILYPSIQTRQTQMGTAFINEFEMLGERTQGVADVLLKVLAQGLHARCVALTVVQ